MKPKQLPLDLNDRRVRYSAAAVRIAQAAAIGAMALAVYVTDVEAYQLTTSRPLLAVDTDGDGGLDSMLVHRETTETESGEVIESNVTLWHVYDRTDEHIADIEAPTDAAWIRTESGDYVSVGSSYWMRTIDGWVEVHPITPECEGVLVDEPCREPEPPARTYTATPAAPHYWGGGGDYCYMHGAGLFEANLAGAVPDGDELCLEVRRTDTGEVISTQCGATGDPLGWWSQTGSARHSFVSTWQVPTLPLLNPDGTTAEPAQTLRWFEWRLQGAEQWASFRAGC